MNIVLRIYALHMYVPLASRNVLSIVVRQTLCGRETRQECAQHMRTG